MKYVLIIGDGMADYPVEELGGKTPLQVADKPSIDKIASLGINGILRTVPIGMDPGSGVANLSILGYDPQEYYSGRGPLEAAAMGIKLGENDVAFRCNIVTEKNGILVDYSAGHITSSEAKELIEAITKKFPGRGTSFYSGVSYRHILVLGDSYSPNVRCMPPHDVVGSPIKEVLPTPMNGGEGTAELLRKMIFESKKVLSDHQVNVKRSSNGSNPGNMIWPWGQGKRLDLPSFQSKYGLKAAVVSAVDLIKGIAVYAGMDVIEVDGATGYYDTNYEGKADAAVKALDDHDFVFVHVESPDEAGHAGDYEQKVKCIEDLDERVVARILNSLKGDYTISVLPDHPTPVKVKTHVRDPVPFAMYSTKRGRDSVDKLDEESAKNGSFNIKGTEFMQMLLGAQ